MDIITTWQPCCLNSERKFLAMDPALHQTDFNGITEIFLSHFSSYDCSFIDVSVGGFGNVGLIGILREHLGK